MGKKKSDMTDSTKYPDDVYFISRDFINQIEELSDGKDIEIRSFYKKFNQYSNAVCYFLGRDRAEQIKKGISEYYDINSTLTEVMMSTKYNEKDKKDNMEELIKTKNKIFKHIKSLDNDIKQENLDIYANLSLLREKKIEEVQCTVLADDIRTKQFLFLGKTIDEIKNNLVKLGAHKIESGHNIGEVLDTEHIIRCISYVGFTKDDANIYGEYMKKLINELQAPIDIENTNEEWENLKKLEVDTGEYLAKMLFFVLNEIRKIKENILNLATMASMGINIFSLK